MGKYLSLSDIVLIERFLVNDFSFAHISNKLDRSPSSILREVKMHVLSFISSVLIGRNLPAHFLFLYSRALSEIL